MADFSDTVIDSARNAAPIPDATYVNVEVRIDPNWPYLSQWMTYAPVQASRILLVFVDQTEGGFDEDAGVSYASSDVVGRDEQYMTYTGNDNRKIPLTIRFVAMGGSPGESGGFGQDNALAGSGGSLVEVVRPARWVERLQHPFSDGRLSYAPPPLILTIGQLLVARVVMTECSIKWEGPFEPGTMLPGGATLNCAFSVVRNAYTKPAADAPAVSSDYDRFIEFPKLSEGGTA